MEEGLEGEGPAFTRFVDEVCDGTTVVFLSAAVNARRAPIQGGRILGRLEPVQLQIATLVSGKAATR